KGFSAHGPDPIGKGTLHLGTFDSAEKAAWIRYLHHQKHKLAYGEFADVLEEWRGYIKGSDDETVIHEMVAIMDASGEKLPDNMPQELIDRARTAEADRINRSRPQRTEKVSPKPIEVSPNIEEVSPNIEEVSPKLD